MKKYLVLLILSINVFACYSQKTDTLKLEHILKFYYLQSNEAQKAGISKEIGKIDWENFNLSKLPVISFNISPISFSKSIVSLQDPISGNYNYTSNYVNNSSTGINIEIPVNYTGGKLNLNSNLNMMREFSLNKNSFRANLLEISYSQFLFGGRKNYEFEKKISELSFKNLDNKTKQKHLEIQRQSVELYLDLLSKDIELKNSQKNKLYSDTVLHLSTIRYTNGEITETELTQVEVQQQQQLLMVEYSTITRSKSLRKLITFLNLEQKEYIVVIPQFQIENNIDFNDALIALNRNNPFFLEKEIRNTEAEQRLYNANTKQIFNLEINMSYGLNQYGEFLYKAYSNPSLQQAFTIGITIPIIDWGKSRNLRRSARLQKMLTKFNIVNEEKQMVESLYAAVEEYNYACSISEISFEKLQLTEKQYQLMIKNYELGQNTFYDLMIANSQLLKSQAEYLKNLSEVWNRYYQIRSIILTE